MCDKSEDIKKEIERNAVDIIGTLKQNEDLARFVEELEEQNKF
jgi:hypothetical protein